MKANVLIVAAAVITIISFGASAQQGGQPPSGGPGMQQGGQPYGGQGGQDQESFEQRKQKLVQRMQDRIADMQHRLSCVQQAQDADAVRECFPRRGERGPGNQGRRPGN
jgi:TolA-binding protein